MESLPYLCLQQCYEDLLLNGESKNSLNDQQKLILGEFLVLIECNRSKPIREFSPGDIKKLQLLKSIIKNGILFSNFMNSSLSTVDDPNCYKGKFRYDPRCRFWYMNNLNQTSFFMNPPLVSLGKVTPYLSQYGCQKMLYYNSTTKNIQTYKVLCLEATLTNISNYFQNVIQSSKQYYIIDPRTLSILYNSNKQYNYSSLQQTDNFYNEELKYLQNKTQSQEFIDIINSNFNKWTFLTQNNYTSIQQMMDLSQKNIIIDYHRNSSFYKVIINPIISYDDIPKHISKYSKIEGQQLQYVYLQINMISNEELKAQTNSLTQFSSQFFLIIQIGLGVLTLIFLFISSYYGLQIANLITQPLIYLTKDLIHINELNKMMEISEIIKDFDRNADELFFSQETQLLYRSFFELFECVLYTSENFFVNNQGQTLLELSKKVNFFRKFENKSAVGIIHNNIGNILLNQQHYFQALEHFSLAIMYAKYEIQQFYNDNNINYLFENIFSLYQFNESNSEKLKKMNNQESQISNLSFKKKNPSFSETQNNLKTNAFNLEQQANNENIQGNSEATSMSPIQQLIPKEIFQNKKKQKNKFLLNSEINDQNFQFQQLNRYYENQEKQKQFFELIESLKSRIYNYIISLIAFQENLEKNQIDQWSYNFWPEIRQLLNDLIQVQSFLPTSESAQALHLCLVSQSSYRLFQCNEAEQKFQEAMQITNNEGKQINQLNIEDKFNFLLDSKQVNTKKYKEMIYLQNQKIQNKSLNITKTYLEDQAKQQSQHQKFIGYSQFKIFSPGTSVFERAIQSQTNSTFQLANSSHFVSNNSKLLSFFSPKNQDQNNNKNNKNLILPSNKNYNKYDLSLSCTKKVSVQSQRNQIVNKILQKEFENQSYSRHYSYQLKVPSLDLVREQQVVYVSYAFSDS
ncbi:transmembrane protein, putative (macronuclear) [Tetrahymena thermophila SB210]|uniref:Transmembrane protein, putative n=1 Tax=Tetrahymena thermophila (strain SB210) TaxID=312017 RepID=Q245P7_TETTS|nr:transmembrane protein, putative [Tetrahymena thermophila SB210]EAS03586.2 transmembrane protein, putative [Tetrahymena thermophila SB210]|eukprot:XP_001023831.2 transmembrane protein, putative [Tetrahymena thermophila SB210]